MPRRCGFVFEPRCAPSLFVDIHVYEGAHLGYRRGRFRDTARAPGAPVFWRAYGFLLPTWCVFLTDFSRRVAAAAV